MKSLRTSASPVRLHSRVEAVHVFPTRVALHVSQGIILLSRHDILYCIAESNYTHIYVSGGRHYILCKTLREVEARLPGNLFFRIHQSYLVNMEAIVCVTRQNVVMHDQKPLPVARTKRQMLLEKIQQTTLSL